MDRLKGKGTGLAAIAALAGIVAVGAPVPVRAQGLRLPPLPPVRAVPELQTLVEILDSLLACTPEAIECRRGFECCDPCATRADGAYCGDEVFPFDDSRNRYFCREGETAAVAFCSQGCENGRCRDPGGGLIVPF